MNVNHRVAVALGFAALSACSPSGTEGNAGSGDEAVPAAAAAPASIEKAAAPDPAPTLERVTRFDIERELSPGAGCELARDGSPLLVAVVGDAIAKPADKLVRLRRSGTDLGSLALGGRFEAGDLSITVTIDPAGAPAEPVSETGGRPAQVTVTKGAASEDFDGLWTCAA